MAVAGGADALGLVGPMPSGPGVITDTVIAQIAAWAPPAVATFLLTSEVTAERIITHARRTRTSVLQLVDDVEAGVYSELRAALPGVKLVQVIHVRSERDVIAAVEIAPHVDALLLDSGRPELKVKELGGTGRTHDWALSRRIVAVCGKPVLLAGGITPANVAEAISAVQPFGIDLCSGVRTNGLLDAGKLPRLLAAMSQRSR